jgi:acyl-CoA synthetase (AMP-forming)/AMP-acid ligase II
MGLTTSCDGFPGRLVPGVAASGATAGDAAALGEAFLATAEARGDAPAILDDALAVALTWREYGAQERRAATGRAALGLRRGDTLGLLLTNRPEFHVADAGALLLGATPFSMYEETR